MQTTLSSSKCEEDHEKAIGGLNVFKFWRRNKNEFRGLSRLARYVLHIPASCSSYEKAFFSLSGRVVEQRTHLSAES